jgi:hypothetical protein
MGSSVPSLAESGYGAASEAARFFVSRPACQRLLTQLGFEVRQVVRQLVIVGEQPAGGITFVEPLRLEHHLR